MSWDSFAYIVQTYWLYLVIALAIGVAVGWFSANRAGQ